MRYFRIRDDCGWIYNLSTDRTDLTAESLVMLTAHVRAAEEISREQFEEEQHEAKRSECAV